jgi:hypothetical protein
MWAVKAAYSGTSGWVKSAGVAADHGEYGTFIAVYTKGGATLTVYDDIGMGGGKIYGLYDDGTATVYKASWVEVQLESGGVAEQTYMESYPQGKGIGSVLLHEGVTLLAARGVKTIKTSMVNGNSAKLADKIDSASASASASSSVSASTPLLASSSHSDADDSCCSSCCFLTTACVTARGLPDDCEELTTLRRFRDGYLMETRDRRAMVESYYQIAPAIVEALWKSKDPQKAFASIYKVIQWCIRLIRAEKYEQALKQYRRMVDQLAEHYLPQPM